MTLTVYFSSTPRITMLSEEDCKALCRLLDDPVRSFNSEEHAMEWIDKNDYSLPMFYAAFNQDGTQAFVS